MEFKHLSESDLQDGKLATDLLSRPTHSDSRGTAIPLIGKSKTGALLTLWLHSRQKRTCYYLKALHEYEAYVTTGEDDGSPRYTVDAIVLHIHRDRDGANYQHPCGPADYCAKSDEIWYTGNACGRSVFHASATMWGQTWSTDDTVID